MSDYAIKGEVIGNIQINAGQTEPVVTFHHDGTITVAHPEKIDEAAKQFLAATQHLLKTGFVVRKKGTSSFLQVRVGDVEWVQILDQATHFARESDAIIASASFNEEVVPASKAMIF